MTSTLPHRKAADKRQARAEAVLALLAAGPRRVDDVAELPAFGGLTYRSRWQAAHYACSNLANRGHLMRVAGGFALPGDYRPLPTAVRRTPEPPRPVYVPSAEWTLEELLAWVAACEGLTGPQLAATQPKALAAVRSAITDRDRLQAIVSVESQKSEAHDTPNEV